MAISAVPQTYTITDLGALPGGANSIARGINAAGWVAGTSDSAAGQFHAFVYEGRSLQDLGTLGGKSSIAVFVDAAGQVIGQSRNPAGDLRAFFFTGGVLHDLGTLGGKDSASNGVALNANGTIAAVVGVAANAAELGRAFLLPAGGVMQDLGSLGGPTSYAEAINSAGQIVGGADIADQVTHAYLFSGGRLQDLGTLGGRYSGATSINDQGQIVGNAETASGAIHAFLFQGGVMQDLGTLGGQNSLANAINGAGQVVGRSDFAGQAIGTTPSDCPDTHAFVYDGSLLNLNNRIPASSGWELVEANAINEAGQIVGYGRLNGHTRAFLLSPA